MTRYIRETWSENPTQVRLFTAVAQTYTIANESSYFTANLVIEIIQIDEFIQSRYIF